MIIDYFLNLLFCNNVLYIKCFHELNQIILVHPTTSQIRAIIIMWGRAKYLIVVQALVPDAEHVYFHAVIVGVVLWGYVIHFFVIDILLN